ncbi:DUF2851 family protein [Larkinella soli]|uniref:DUF2851 family protein n=1 Tax=Larkinella soli TaxID=1770527 RepID=UPI001E42F265|nr:DUF2851 family protein [Larkinella soli]
MSNLLSPALTSEDFLYFLWQFRYFRHIGLRTTQGERIRVVHPGFRNPDSGPDFTNARIVLGEVEWVGTVEAHIRASDWLVHRHQYDPAYDNVILHIVWENATLPIRRRDGSVIPTLCLSDYTDPSLLLRYRSLIDGTGLIPCAGRLSQVEPLRRMSMFDKVLFERLARKAAEAEAVYRSSDSDWEETAYRLMAQAFGFQINAEPFAQLTRLVPLKFLLKHRDQPFQMEALLFGTAGLLSGEPTDDYEITLLREYRFLAAKYRLTEKRLPGHLWKWSRLRPANFPTLRLAQFVALLAGRGSFFSLLMETDAPTLLRHLQAAPSAYWQTHYRFGPPSARVSSTLGETAARSLIINAVIPLLIAYSCQKGLPAYRDRAVALLEELPAEQNRITALWSALHVPLASAFDSQAALELYTSYCCPKKCLSCQIGLEMVK